MKLTAAAISAVAIAGVVFFGAAFALVGQQGSASTNNAYVRGDITPVSPRVAGQVVEVGVTDNQAVKAGDILLRVDDADYRARVAQAQATLQAKIAALGALDSRVSLQGAVIQQAGASLLGARAESTRTDSDLSRTTQLMKAGWVSAARTEQVTADRQKADAKVAEARANLAAADRQVGVIESQRPQLLADVEAARAALRLAQIDLDSTVIRAPVDGWVGERQARVGQYVRPGSLLIAVVSRDVWVVANFKETQVSRMAPGSTVSITTDSAPGQRFRGRVDSLSPASGAQFALLPPDNATGNFTRIVQRIPVRVTLEPGQPGLAALRPGMSANVSVKG